MLLSSMVIFFGGRGSKKINVGSLIEGTLNSKGKYFQGKK